MICRRYRFGLSLSADTVLEVYRGAVSAIRVLDEHGQVIEFPARALRPYVTHSGVDGFFELQVSPDHRLISCRRAR